MWEKFKGLSLLLSSSRRRAGASARALVFCRGGATAKLSVLGYVFVEPWCACAFFVFSFLCYSCRRPTHDGAPRAETASYLYWRYIFFLGVTAHGEGDLPASPPSLWLFSFVVPTLLNPPWAAENGATRNNEMVAWPDSEIPRDSSVWSCPCCVLL